MDRGCFFSARGGPGETLAMKGIRVGLLILFAYSVLAFGTVEVWSESLLEIGASILLISWAVIAYRDKRSAIA